MNARSFPITNLQKPGKLHRVSESCNRFPHGRLISAPITIPNFHVSFINALNPTKTPQNPKSPWKSPTKNIQGPFFVWQSHQCLYSTSLLKGIFATKIPFLNLTKGYLVEIPQYNLPGSTVKPPQNWPLPTYIKVCMIITTATHFKAIYRVKYHYNKELVTGSVFAPKCCNTKTGAVTDSRSCWGVIHFHRLGGAGGGHGALDDLGETTDAGNSQLMENTTPQEWPLK